MSLSGHLEGFSAREVCDRLGRPPGTERSQTKRGLALLSERLAGLFREERPGPG
jgi:DNA-directed RNA polymerase specialized sigma24 family protein